MVKKVLAEIVKMECFNHPNVVPLMGVCLEAVAISIVMPRMVGSLLDYLRNNRERLKPLTSNSEVYTVEIEIQHFIACVTTTVLLHVFWIFIK